MDIDVTEYYTFTSSWIFYIIMFVIFFIPTIIFWFLIRKKNLVLAKKFDLMILLLSQVAIIGVILSGIVRVVEYTEYSDGWESGSGSSYYYEIGEFGSAVLFIALVSLMVTVLLFAYKEIKYKRIIRVSRAVLSIATIIMVFSIIIPALWWYTEPERDTYYWDDYSLGGKVNPDDSIDFAYSNGYDILFFKVRDDKIVTEKKFKTNAFTDISYTSDSEKLYCVYGILDPDAREFDINYNPIEEFQIIELPKEMSLRNNIIVDDNNNLHLIIQYDAVNTYSIGNDFRYYTISRGYYIYYNSNNKLDKIDDGDFMGISRDSNNNVYLLYYKSLNASQPAFCVQKRAPDGSILFDLEFENFTPDDYFYFWDYTFGMEMDRNNDIHLLYGNSSEYMKYLRMDSYGNILNSTHIKNFTTFQNYPVIKNENNDLIIFNDIDYIQTEQHRWYGIIDNENNIHIFSIENYIIHYEIFDKNGNLKVSYNFTEIPQIEEFYGGIDEEVIYANTMITLFSSLVSLIIIISFNLGLFLYAKRLEKKGKESIIIEKYSGKSKSTKDITVKQLLTHKN